MRLSVRRCSSCAVMLVLALTACHDATGPTYEMVSAHLRWAAHGPASYQLTVAHGCECLPETIGPVVVSVMNGEVQSRTYERTGEPVPERYTGSFPSVEGLFAYIDSVQQRGSTPIDVRFDPSLGYPVFITVGDHPEVDGVITTEVELSPLPEATVR